MRPKKSKGLDLEDIKLLENLSKSFYCMEVSMLYQNLSKEDQAQIMNIVQPFFDLPISAIDLNKCKAERVEAMKAIVLKEIALHPMQKEAIDAKKANKTVLRYIAAFLTTLSIEYEEACEELKKPLIN